MPQLRKTNVAHLHSQIRRPTSNAARSSPPSQAPLQKNMQEQDEDVNRSPESSIASSEIGEEGVKKEEEFADIDELEPRKEVQRKALTGKVLRSPGEGRSGRKKGQRGLENGVVGGELVSSPLGRSSPGGRKRKREAGESASASAPAPVFAAPSSSSGPGLSQIQEEMFSASASQKGSQVSYARRPWNVNGNGNFHAATRKQTGSQGSNGANGRAAAEPDKRSVPLFKTFTRAASPNQQAIKLRSPPKALKTARPRSTTKDFKRPTIRPPTSHSGSSSPLSSAPSTTSSITPPPPAHAGTSPSNPQIQVQRSSPLCSPSPQPTTAECPICAAPVSPSHLATFTRGKSLTYTLAQRFCASHKKRDAEALSSSSKFKDKDWSTFDDQLRKYHPVILGILDGTIQSRYRTDLEDRIAKGDRNLLRRPDAGLLPTTSAHPNTSATLHNDHGVANGPRNTYSSYPVALATTHITTHILQHFSSHLRQAATRDKLFLEIGVPGFVQGVLVPEVLVGVVGEDLGVGQAEALRIVGQGAGAAEGAGTQGYGLTQIDALERWREMGDASEGGTFGNGGHGVVDVDVDMDVAQGRHGRREEGEGMSELNGVQRLENGNPTKSPKRNKRPKTTTTPVKARATRSRVLEGVIELSP